jgi:Skp family chaperone for outer membrane proteins
MPRKIFSLVFWCVVDLDRVAKELGRDVQMANDLKSSQTALLNELATIQKDANEELKKMQTELGEDAPAEELQKLKQTADIAQQRFNQLQKTADVKLGQRRDFLVASFRQQARPIVYQVAKDHGAKAVVTETVLYTFDETIDITDAVIAKMRSTPAAAAPTTPTAPATAPEAATSGPVAEAKPAPAAAPAGDSKIRQASATTAKPAPKAKPAQPAKDK